jgi:hypothetical protein
LLRTGAVGSFKYVSCPVEALVAAWAASAEIVPPLALDRAYDIAVLATHDSPRAARPGLAMSAARCTW